MKVSLTQMSPVAAMLALVLSGALVPAQDKPAAPAPTPVKTYIVPEGTRIPLSLKSEISSAYARAGDPVFCVSEFPVVREGAVVIPAGTYVRGIIDAVKRPGKVKGRAQLQLHFTTLVFPNGVEISLDAPIAKAPTEVSKEGTVKQSSGVGHDAQTVANTTALGASVGALASIGSGNYGMGTGVGAGAGAVTGILTTLFTRGKDLVIPQGTSLEMVFARPVNIQSTQLSEMNSVTGAAAPAK